MVVCVFVFAALSFDFYSEDNNEYTLLRNIELKYKESESYEIYLALLLARNNLELASIKDIITKAMNDERFQNVAFVVFDTLPYSDSQQKFSGIRCFHNSLQTDQCYLH